MFLSSYRNTMINQSARVFSLSYFLKHDKRAFKCYFWGHLILRYYSVFHTETYRSLSFVSVHADTASFKINFFFVHNDADLKPPAFCTTLNFGKHVIVVFTPNYYIIAKRKPCPKSRSVFATRIDSPYFN